METTTYSILVQFLRDHKLHIVGTTDNYAAIQNYFSNCLRLFAYDSNAVLFWVDDMPTSNKKRNLTTYNVDEAEDRERLRKWLWYDYKNKKKSLQRLIGALHQFLAAGEDATYAQEEKIKDAMADIAYHYINETGYAEQATRLHYFAKMILDNYAPRILNQPPGVKYVRNRYDVELYRLILSDVTKEIKRINRYIPKIIDMLVNHQAYAVTD